MIDTEELNALLAASRGENGEQAQWDAIQELDASGRELARALLAEREAAERMERALAVFAAHAKHMPTSAPITFTKNYDCPLRIGHTFSEAFSDAVAAIDIYRAVVGAG